MSDIDGVRTEEVNPAEAPACDTCDEWAVLTFAVVSGVFEKLSALPKPVRGPAIDVLFDVLADNGVEFGNAA